MISGSLNQSFCGKLTQIDFQCHRQAMNEHNWLVVAELLQFQSHCILWIFNKHDRCFQ